MKISHNSHHRQDTNLHFSRHKIFVKTLSYYVIASQLLLCSEFDPHWVPYICGLEPNLSYILFLRVPRELNSQAITSEFDSHWVFYSSGLVQKIWVVKDFKWLRIAILKKKKKKKKSWEINMKEQTEKLILPGVHFLYLLQFCVCNIYIYMPLFKLIEIWVKVGVFANTLKKGMNQYLLHFIVGK